MTRFSTKRPRIRRRAVMLGGIAGVAALAGCLPPTTPSSTGPSTVTAPYVLPDASGVEVQSILTVSDSGSAANGYEMVGIPDGMGAYQYGNTVRVLMNNELGSGAGVTRAHGQRGAFVEDLRINQANGAITSGEDLIDPGARYYDYLTDTYAASPNGPGQNITTGKPFPAYNAAFNRFCSGTLTGDGQLFNPATGKGYDDRLYFANEEGGDESRVFAVTMAGKAVQLPRLGLFSWENTVPARNQSDTTLVMGQEDGPSDGSQLWVYAGTKTNSGGPVDRAGLTNGTDYVVRTGGGAMSDPAVRAAIAAAPGKSVRFDLTEVDWRQNGVDQNIEAKAEGLNLNRIEDGHWDPANKNVFYFVTTQGGVGANAARDGGGLWRLTYDDIEQPLLGGKLELLLDGSESIGLNKPDNMTIDNNHGIILIQEDPGNNDHVARIVAYRISDGATRSIAKFDPVLFDPMGGTNPSLVTKDEESSGIIDVSNFNWGTNIPYSTAILDKNYANGGLFLFDAQVHATAGLDNPAAQVERGQVLFLGVTDWSAIFAAPPATTTTAPTTSTTAPSTTTTAAPTTTTSSTSTSTTSTSTTSTSSTSTSTSTTSTIVP